MNRIDYLISHPQDVKKTDIPLLKNEVEKYPYFYSLRALLLYGLKHENHPSFEDHLHGTSIYSNNRVDLYHYLNSKPLTQKESQKKVDAAIESSSNEQIIKDLSVDTDQINIAESDSINLAMTATKELNDVTLTGEIEEKVETNPSAIPSKQENPLEKMLIQSERNKTIPTDTKQIEETPTIVEEEIQSIIVTEKTINKAEPISDQKDINPLLGIENSETILSENLSEDKEKITHQPQEQMNNTIENDLSSNEITYSFNDWLKHSNLAEDEQNSETSEKEIKYQLIDDFLERNPKITPLKKNDQGPNTISVNFQKNSEEFSDLMTETLAQIYIEQKKYDKAIKAYKILSLKYPEKNSLFANRIKEIEKFKNTKS